MARKIEAVYEGGVFHPVNPVDLAEHQRVIVIIDEAAASEDQPDRTNGQAAHVAPGPKKHIWEIADDLLSDIPEEAFEELPTDGATQLDHYIYGTPKRST